LFCYFDYHSFSLCFFIQIFKKSNNCKKRFLLFYKYKNRPQKCFRKKNIINSTHKNRIKFHKQGKFVRIVKKRELNRKITIIASFLYICISSRGLGGLFGVPFESITTRLSFARLFALGRKRRDCAPAGRVVVEKQPRIVNHTVVMSH
jgi:hypothetical protein